MKTVEISKDKYQLAVKYFNQGNLLDAELILNELLLKKKNDYDVHNFLGIIKLNQKKYDEAVKKFHKVLEYKPSHPNVTYNLGLSYQSLGQIDQAIYYYKRFLEKNNSNVDVLLKLASLYLIKEQFDLVEEIYAKAIKQFPEDERLLLNYSNYLMAKDKFDEIVNMAVDERRIFQSNFTIALAGYFINKAKAFSKLGKNDKALELLLKVHSVNPRIPDLLLAIANIYLIKYENEKAQDFFAKLIDTNLAAAGLNGLGLIQIREMNIKKAEDYFRQAVKKDLQTPDYHYNLAHSLLLEGKLEEGFLEYEWRKKRPEFLKRTFTKPELQNEDIYNKKILLWDEQGIGDIIQFIRYAKLLKQRGAEVYFQCASNVVGLFKDFKFVDKIIPRVSDEEPAVEYDYHISLLSLPRYFSTTIETIPDKDKYISPNQNLVEKWKIYFSKFHTKKVGIAWAGNPKHTNDKNRSVKLKCFANLFKNKNYTFFSLQKGAGLEQAEEFNDELIVLDSNINTLSDTAAIIENLDFVISVDTSVVHLAGALGKKTLLLLPFSPDWRWLKEEDYSVWYDSVKIFRQKSPGNWDEVFEEVSQYINDNERVDYKNKSETSQTKRVKLFLGLTSGENFGWGVCSKYLKKELHKKIEAESLEMFYSMDDEEKIEGKVFHGLTDLEFNSIYKIRGTQNYGYTFFENELLPSSIVNSKKYDLVIGGSTWCKEKMEQKGITNTDVLIQGIDPDLFYPITTPTNENLFVIFSGGKFELRKGQDLVLAAVKHLMQKYKNVILINAWYNFWVESLITMSRSNYIDFEVTAGKWNDVMMNVYNKNGLDTSRIFTLPITPNEKLRELYAKTDIGLFPNRCEGGTNLVMMEYMACGKPVIASFTSGHKDILNEENSLLLKNFKEFKIYENQALISDWEEPELDEIIFKVEYAYENRNEIKKIGVNAGKFMMNYTWTKTAEDLLRIISV